VPLAAAFVLLDSTGWRALVVALAAATDWIDGRIARGRGQTTSTGEWLDPLADKTFMVAALVTIVVERGVPPWTLPLLLTRDIGVLLGALFLFGRGQRRRMRARRVGKAVTWLQFAAVGLILLVPPSAVWLAIPLALLGAWAVLDYARAATETR